MQIQEACLADRLDNYCKKGYCNALALGVVSIFLAAIGYYLVASSNIDPSSLVRAIYPLADCGVTFLLRSALFFGMHRLLKKHHTEGTNDCEVKLSGDGFIRKSDDDYESSFKWAMIGTAFVIGFLVSATFSYFVPTDVVIGGMAWGALGIAGLATVFAGCKIIQGFIREKQETKSNLAKVKVHEEQNDEIVNARRNLKKQATNYLNISDIYQESCLKMSLVALAGVVVLVATAVLMLNSSAEPIVTDVVIGSVFLVISPWIALSLHYGIQGIKNEKEANRLFEQWLGLIKKNIGASLLENNLRAS